MGIRRKLNWLVKKAEFFTIMPRKTMKTVQLAIIRHLTTDIILLIGKCDSLTYCITSEQLVISIKEANYMLMTLLYCTVGIMKSARLK